MVEITFKELVSLESARIWPLYLVLIFSFMSSASVKSLCFLVWKTKLVQTLSKSYFSYNLLLFPAIASKYVYYEVETLEISFFLDFCWVFLFFLGQYPQKMYYQNHHQQAIYLNVSNFLMIYQPKNNNKNLSLSGWYLTPISPGLIV